MARISFFLALFMALVWNGWAQPSDSSAVSSTISHRFSMAFYITPFYSGAMVTPELRTTDYPPIIYEREPINNWFFNYDYTVTSEQRFFAGGDFSVTLWKKLVMRFNIHIFQKHLQVEKTDYTVQNGQQEDLRIKKIKSTITLISPRFSLKYYFRPLKIRSVVPYVILGLGKQFPLVNFSYEETPSSDNKRYNFKEFLKDINSGSIVLAGAGTEYVLNSSLTFFSRIEVESFASRGTFNSQFNYSSQRTIIDSWKIRSIYTYWSFGIRMYF